MRGSTSTAGRLAEHLLQTASEYFVARSVDERIETETDVGQRA